MHAARLTLSLVVTLGAVVAATTTAGATAETGVRVHKVPPPKRTPPAHRVIASLEPGSRANTVIVVPERLGPGSSANTVIVVPGRVDGVIVPAPAPRPELFVIVPEDVFADARAYPLGMILAAPPTVHRHVIVLAVADRAPALAPLFPMGLSLCGLGVIGLAFAGARRRSTGSLAHPLGSL